MSPPTEQLIRDYLNRLSVAARGQLDTGDRRALVDRTRQFIERKTEVGGPPTALEVGRLLSGLGDPAGLVSQERQRLAALRGEPPQPPVDRGRLARVLRGEPGKVRGASWHWPVQPGSRADLQITLIDGAAPAAGPVATAGAPAGRETARPVAAEAAAQLVPSPAPPADPRPHHADTARPLWPALTAGAAHDVTIGRDAAEPDIGQHEIVDGEVVDSEIADGHAGARGTTEPDADQQELDRQSPAPNAPTAVPDVRPAGLAAMNWQAGPAAPERLPRSRQLVAKAADWSRRHKLEAAALALLGLGGVIFPPVWFLGAAVTLASRLWDYRDKWTALALPIVLTVLGTAVGVAVGSRVSFGHGMHDAWAFAVDFSRATAVLSACYLGWRAGRGPRPPAVPPWDRPHRIT
ncbi:MAG TPA: hypothetical protein VMA73_12310 [Streptosporangiaceae bacterium]|nr:hypothetical protein [Streptosporangiaceae bacterium]